MGTNSLFWIDMEMTGLDETIHKIVEVAVIVTDFNLNPKEEYHRVVYQPQAVINFMDEWCKKTHGASGLTEAIPKGTPLETVDKEVSEIIGRFFEKSQKVVLVGNSIGQDKKFIDRYMPKTAGRLHYRVIDVSSFKEIFRCLFGVEVKKKNAHRAIDDIRESIAELKTYLTHIPLPRKSSHEHTSAT